MAQLGLPRIPYRVHRTLARAQVLWGELSGAHEAEGLSAAAGNAQPEARLAVVVLSPLEGPLAAKRYELPSDP